MLELATKLMEAKEKYEIFLVEIYKIKLPNGDLYLTSLDTDVTYNGQLYKSVPIQRDSVTSTVDDKQDNSKLHVSNFDDSFTAAIFSGYDFRGSRIWVYQILYPDALTDPTLITPITWGYLDTPVLNTKEGTFVVDICSDSPNQDNARTCQMPCNSVFGDEACGITPVTVTGTADNTSTQTVINCASIGSTNFLHGIAIVGAEGRKIVSSTTNSITVEYPFIEVVPGATVKIQQNCDKTTADCDRYSNRKHYSGFLQIPFEMIVKS